LRDMKCLHLFGCRGRMPKRKGRSASIEEIGFDGRVGRIVDGT
jgi:hypothetical protein